MKGRCYVAKKKMTFEGAFAKVPKKAWEVARQAEPGGKRERPVIDDGVYPCELRDAKADTDGDGNPYVVIPCFVIEGEFAGVRLEKFHSLKDWDADLPRLVKTLKGAGYEITEPDPAKAGGLIKSIIADINANHPQAMVSAKNGTYTAKKDTEDYKKGDEVPKLDVYINRPLSVEEGATTKAPAKKPVAARGKKK